jgi:hypothetical protein
VGGGGGGGGGGGEGTPDSTASSREVSPLTTSFMCEVHFTEKRSEQVEQ